MSAPGRENLLLALGNDLLGDDGVALTAARLLRQEFQDEVEVVESAEAGLALVEMLEGYERALLLDAVVTGRCPPGTVLEFSPGDFQKIVAPSPHYAGIPEVLNLAERLGISFPKEIRILALEVESPYEFQERLSPSVEQALPAFVESARRVLERWKGKGVCANQGRTGVYPFHGQDTSDIGAEDSALRAETVKEEGYAAIRSSPAT